MILEDRRLPKYGRYHEAAYDNGSFGDEQCMFLKILLRVYGGNGRIRIYIDRDGNEAHVASLYCKRALVDNRH